MSDWKIYEKSTIRKNDKITMTTSGGIGFPAYFCQKNNINDYAFVTLLFNNVENAIAIQFTKEEVQGKSFKLIIDKTGKGAGGGYIRATSFLEDSKITYKDGESKRFDYEKSTIEGFGEVYIVRLPNKAASISPPQT